MVRFFTLGGLVIAGAFAGPAAAAVVGCDDVRVWLDSGDEMHRILRRLARAKIGDPQGFVDHCLVHGPPVESLPHVSNTRSIRHGQRTEIDFENMEFEGSLLTEGLVCSDPSVPTPGTPDTVDWREASTERFAGHEVSGVVLVDDDPMSTCSIDVDPLHQIRTAAALQPEATAGLGEQGR
jgi:hypothetical protein